MSAPSPTRQVAQVGDAVEAALPPHSGLLLVSWGSGRGAEGQGSLPCGRSFYCCVMQCVGQVLPCGLVGLGERVLCSV